MKTVPCPRCQGAGVIDEEGTLIGLSPFQDRPSVVNDDEWVAPPEEPGEPTLVQEVPSFKMPKDVPLRIPSPRPPPDNTRFAYDSERPTKVVHRRDVTPRRRGWPWVLLVALAAGGLGFAIRKGLAAAWFDIAVRTVCRHVQW